MTISIIEEQRGKQPLDLTDQQSDHLRRYQARAAADHDGGIRRTHPRRGRLEHRQLPCHAATGE
jgi:hypothetical protein